MPVETRTMKTRKSKTKSRRTVGQQIAAANKIKKNIRSTLRRKKVKKKRRSAATKIQKKVRDTRMNVDKGIQYKEFLSYLKNEYGADLKKVKEWFYIPDIRHNILKTELLMIDTTTDNGAMKRTLVCVDTDRQGYIDSVNKNCLTDSEAARWIDVGPFLDASGNPYWPSMLSTRRQAWRATRRGANRDGIPIVGRDGYIGDTLTVPTVGQVGLTDEEVLDLLEYNSVNYCKYPVFKRLCIKLRRNIILNQRPQVEKISSPERDYAVSRAGEIAALLTGEASAKPVRIPTGIVLPSGNTLWTNDRDYKDIIDIAVKFRNRSNLDPTSDINLIDNIMYTRMHYNRRDWLTLKNMMKNN